ncbi:MAG: tyrosine-type recombinase/integrase [Endomicrobium sp.]|jgi:site-specific recombinase XerD|nr:tyrosine-type recombinase/integrase [Endomicrobium sp.]
MSSKLTKRGDRWSFRYREEGKHKRKTINAASFKEAQRLQLDFLSSLNNNGQLSNITASAFINEYFNYSKTNKRAATSCQNKILINKFLGFCTENNIKFLKDITIKCLEDYKTVRMSTGIMPSTINQDLRVIKAMLQKAVEWKYLGSNICKSVKFFKLQVRPPRFLSDLEIKALLSATTEIYKNMAVIGLYTGFRISEVYNLQWKDINFESNAVSVTPKHNFTPKDNEFRSIPLNIKLKNFLLSIKPKGCNGTDYVIAERVYIGFVFKKFKKIFQKELKLQNVTFHTLRHTFASHLVIKGISLFTISKLLGHSSIKTTMIYAHLSKEHLKSSVDMLDFGS